VSVRLLGMSNTDLLILLFCLY